MLYWNRMLYGAFIDLVKQAIEKARSSLKPGQERVKRQKSRIYALKNDLIEKYVSYNASILGSRARARYTPSNSWIHLRPKIEPDASGLSDSLDRLARREASNSPPNEKANKRLKTGRCDFVEVLGNRELKQPDDDREYHIQ